MIKTKTVFILGAGASHELNLPLGEQLRTNIANLLCFEFHRHYGGLKSGDEVMANTLGRIAEHNQIPSRQILNACDRIRAGINCSPSIDNFIHSNSHDKTIEVCGKLGIIKSILHAEQHSSLYSQNYSTFDFTYQQKPIQSWHMSLMQIFSCQKSEVHEALKNISFIVFNYDRCLEHFLYHALQKQYGFAPQESAELIMGIEIYHPYGTVGKLPWQSTNGEPTFDFGLTPTEDNLLKLIGSIKTFTEGIDPESSDICAIRKLICNAETIVSLGFAFNDQNMNLLSIKREKDYFQPGRRFFGTAFGESDYFTNNMTSEIRIAFGIQEDLIHLRNDLTCFGLFKEFKNVI